MAALTVTVTLLVLACPMVLSANFYTGPMAAVDKAALEAMKAAVVNKTNFPEIKCYAGVQGVDMLSVTKPFRCTNTGRLLTAILSGRNLGGIISPEVGKLSKLIYLYLNGNKFGGTIPASIGNLYDISILHLENNTLSGSIPLSIGNLKVVEHVHLDNNLLTGGIPSTLISNMTSVMMFSVKANYLIGPVTPVAMKLTCALLTSNCLKTGCAVKDQRTTATCTAFCNASQTGGPCGGFGVCSIGTTGPSCTCNKGYNNKVNKFTCKRG